MKTIKFNSAGDLTEENLALFEESIKELDIIYPQKINESDEVTKFDSLDECLKYYDAIPFEDFNKKFRKEK